MCGQRSSRYPGGTPDSRNLADEKVGDTMSAYMDAKYAREAYKRGEMTVDELADYEIDARLEAEQEAREWEDEYVTTDEDEWID